MKHSEDSSKARERQALMWTLILLAVIKKPIIRYMNVTVTNFQQLGKKSFERCDWFPLSQQALTRCFCKRKSVPFQIGKSENYNNMTSSGVTTAPVQRVHVEHILEYEKLGMVPPTRSRTDGHLDGWMDGWTAGRMTDSGCERISLLRTILFLGHR